MPMALDPVRVLRTGIVFDETHLLFQRPKVKRAESYFHNQMCSEGGRT